MMLDVFKRFTEEISETKKGAQWEIARLEMFERFSLAKVCLVDLRHEHFERYIVERSQLVKLSSINREFNGLSNTVELNANFDSILRDEFVEVKLKIDHEVLRFRVKNENFQMLFDRALSRNNIDQRISDLDNLLNNKTQLIEAMDGKISKLRTEYNFVALYSGFQNVLELRMSLCQFIEAYSKFETEINRDSSALLSNFEALVFSLIVAKESDIPPLIDGVNQIADLISKIRK